MINELIARIKEKKSVVCVGLDPFLNKLPKEMITGTSKEEAAESILNFNKKIIDAVWDIVPAVKPQCAFYEQFGWQGILTLEHTIKYAKSKGLFVIVDGKRNDIGSTAVGYAKAFLTEEGVNASALTVNGYLGVDGIKPFLDTGKMIFVLAKTSNPSSGELQDLRLDTGETVYEKMADLCQAWGSSASGYSNCGIVVGATYPEQIKEMREKAPNTFFLIPGYGIQGGKAEDIAHAFDNEGLGSLVSASRSVLYAWEKHGDSENFAKYVREEAVNMRDDINKYRRA